jgi:Predicted P-loop ATPase
MFSEFENYMNLREEFRKTIKTLVPQTGVKRVIIIDELDRCKPPFAVETLEVVKHLFDVENIQFIFAVDIEQLSHSIATMYGQNMDASGYLRRFFDLQLVFPAVNTLEFIKPQFIDDNSLKTSINHIAEISTNLNLTLRDIEKFTSYLKLLSKTSLNHCFEDVAHPDKLFAIYYYLIVLNSKYPEFWKYIIEYTGDSNLNNFRVDIGQKYAIPSRYFIDEKTTPAPQAVVNFCRNILLSSDGRNKVLREIYAHSTTNLNPDVIRNIGLNKSNRDFTIIRAIQNVLAVLSLDIIKEN